MSLRPLTEPDLELILPWRNAPDVRRAMYNKHKISLKEHLAWFQRLHQDPSRLWYLYQDTFGGLQGVAYFTSFASGQSSTFWGFYARPGAPAGTGLRILFDALDLAFSELDLHKINSEVLADNERSINLHKRVGFTEEGRFRQQHFDGEAHIDIIRFGLLAREWPEHRDRLVARIADLDSSCTSAAPNTTSRWGAES